MLQKGYILPIALIFTYIIVDGILNYMYIYVHFESYTLRTLLVSEMDILKCCIFISNYI